MEEILFDGQGALDPGDELDLTADDWRYSDGAYGDKPLRVTIARPDLGAGQHFDDGFHVVVELADADLPWIYVRLGALPAAKLKEST